MGRPEATLAQFVGVFFITIALIAVLNSPTDIVAWIAGVIVFLVGLQTLWYAAKNKGKA